MADEYELDLNDDNSIGKFMQDFEKVTDSGNNQYGKNGLKVKASCSVEKVENMSYFLNNNDKGGFKKLGMDFDAYKKNHPSSSVYVLSAKYSDKEWAEYNFCIILLMKMKRFLRVIFVLGLKEIMKVQKKLKQL